ncbi:class I adenylate-forming enzyme family protein [Streptomyces bicolor]|uniref:class I adenylate-forming enzyme family protein n=1 Tax=Streptomyces bicolor TaxID=66874 RepID=UPI00068B9856|nr:fatty acid--CoA ligase family protein [Streptomyces bicolor]
MATTRIIDPLAPHASLDAEAYAAAVARVLRDRGVRSGDRVLVKAGNSALYPALLFALIHLDTSVVLLDGQQTHRATERFAALARARYAVLDGADPAPTGVTALSTADLAADAAAHLPAAPATALSDSRWRARDDALVLWSSGSTGEPKGIVKPGRAVLENLERTRRLMDYGPQDVFLPLLPFSHQYGLSLLLLARMAGADLLITPYTRLDRALRLGAEHGATVVDATPATYLSMLNLDDRRPGLLAALDRVRLWCTGGAPMDGGLGRRFAATAGAPLLDGYGSTEAGNVAFATPGNPVGCGRVLDGIEVLVTGEDGTPLPPGEIGEIRLRTPDLMAGYMTTAAALDPPAAGPYRTGDLGHLDAAGNLFVLGRASAVHRLGHTLYPEVLEHRAAACGRPVKIIPLEDARRGHELVFVVADPTGGDARHWRERICALLAPFEQPNHLLVVDSFPVTHRGKVDVPALTARVVGTLEQRIRVPAARPDRNERNGRSHVTQR